VEVSEVVFNVSPNNVAQLDVFISGPGPAVDPNQSINIDSNTGADGSVRSFQWIKRDILAGSTQTVNIDFAMGLQGELETPDFVLQRLTCN
jgi:hypothetical protein